MTDLRICPGSGGEVQLAWLMDVTHAGTGICPVCNRGVTVRRDSVRPGLSPDGYSVWVGLLRVHYSEDQ